MHNITFPAQLNDLKLQKVAQLQYCSTTVLHYYITTVLQYYSIALLLHCISTLLLYCITTVLHYCSIALLQYYSTVVFQYTTAEVMRSGALPVNQGLWPTTARKGQNSIWSLKIKELSQYLCVWLFVILINVCTLTT